MLDLLDAASARWAQADRSLPGVRGGTPRPGPSLFVRPFSSPVFEANTRISWNYDHIVYQKELDIGTSLQIRPGSTLFLVWSQSRQASTQEPELQPFANLGKSFGDGGANLFLVKLN